MQNGSHADQNGHIQTIDGKIITDPVAARKEALQRWQYLCLDTDNSKRIQQYDDLAPIYDKDTAALGWMGPKLAAKVIQSKFPNDKNVRVLDVCAGTGAVAFELKKIGYHNLDMLDGSRGMTKIAMERNLYKCHVCQVIEDGVPVVINSNIYNAAIISGGHVSPAKVSEMNRVVKSGGYIILALFLEGENDRKEYGEVMDHIKLLEKQKVCKLVSAEAIQQISLDEDGKPVPGGVVVMQKF
jgi:ubiquinone/menaquinone biosynthesis C-methylase UbiE